MANDYQTTFTIPDRAGIGTVPLLKDVMDRIERELVSGTSGNVGNAPPLDVEHGATDDEAYARISTERDHPRREGLQLRLDVRLCTIDRGISVEIVSRFLIDDVTAVRDLPAGPPRLLQPITDSYECLIGTHRISYSAQQVDETNLEDFVKNLILSPERTLPLLLLSPKGNQGPVMNGAVAQRGLAGVAIVATFNDSAARQLSSHVGAKLTAYNGSVRVVWPGATFDTNGEGLSFYEAYSQAERKGRGFIKDIQELCIENAPRANNFADTYLAARAAAIFEKNRLLEQQIQSAPEVREIESREILTFRRQVEELRANLNQERRQVRKIARDLQATQEQLDAAIQERDAKVHALQDIRDAIDIPNADDQLVLVVLGELRRLRPEIEQLQARIQDISSQLEQERERANTLVEERDKAWQEIAYLRAVITPQDEAGNTGSVAEYKKVRDELKEERLRRGKAERDARHSIKQIDVLSRKLEDAQQVLKDIAAFVGDPDDPKQAVSKIMGQLKTLQGVNDQLNSDNKKLKESEHKLRNQAKTRGLRMDFPHPGNVTVLNYAINLFRDPMRKHIFATLGANNDDELAQMLKQSVDFSEWNYGSVRDFVDVSNFPGIVEHEQSKFTSHPRLVRLLNDVRLARNRAAHPHLGGLEKAHARDGLAKIADVLAEIGETELENKVKALMDLVA